MSLISVQRSPSPDLLEDGEDGPSAVISDSDGTHSEHSSQIISRTTVVSSSTTAALGKSRSLSECYFSTKGAAVILSHSDQNDSVICPREPAPTVPSEIEVHLQSMLRILRTEHTLTMAVRLQCSKRSRARYLSVVIAADTASDTHEAALFGFDFLPEGKMVIGVTVPLLTASRVELDGDGGIRVRSSPTAPLHLFKPTSIQSMWSLFQCLHREIQLAVAQTSSGVPLFSGTMSHLWLNHYHQHKSTDDALMAQWHYSIVDEAAVGDISASSSLNADDLPQRAVKSKEQLDDEGLIRANLLQIMQSVDLDEVTSGDIRNRLEEQLQRNLSAHKEFIDQEMLFILGRLDRPSQIFNYLFLGTEWNASNWEELKANNVGYILNVTKEVDNFFPAQFNYLKIWVSDEANAELLMHWQRTHSFIKEAKEKGSSVLVHCKKGISRSSSTVIAYVMKEYGWSLEKSLGHVKERRNCITPNSGFMEQLETFCGVLQASSNRHSAVFNIVSNPSTASFASVTSSCSSTTSSPPTSDFSAGVAASTLCSKLGKSELEATTLSHTSMRREKELRTLTGKKPAPPDPPRRSNNNGKRPPLPPAGMHGSVEFTPATAADSGKRRQSASTLLNTGRVKEQRFYFESRIKSKAKGKSVQATSIVGSIAKSLGRFSLISNSRLNIETEFKKKTPHQQGQQSMPRHSFTARRNHFDKLAATGQCTTHKTGDGYKNMVRGLVDIFETRSCGDADAKEKRKEPSCFS